MAVSKLTDEKKREINYLMHVLTDSIRIHKGDLEFEDAEDMLDYYFQHRDELEPIIEEQLDGGDSYA